MAIFKCKMCGGNILINPGETVGICDSCQTRQTLPRIDDERKENLYDRANHYRRANDYDRAMGMYEQILNEDNTDAEAYWSLVLCRYGIEYVEDPATHRRVPTVNRTQFTSIYADEDYKSALEHADPDQRAVYENEARQIDEIQKGILQISQNEKPFDVFICYKETDENGRRTQDSVLANDLYYQLTQEGFKVFFARITLEDKLGTAYEPYIFAALNSARAMVVIGTRREYFNAPWVKNEWSRYLALVKASRGSKTLIPAYRDMDPYDLPEAFSHLQAQDMSKLGFMQDLIRGIRKIIGSNAPGEALKNAQTRPASQTNSANEVNFIKRATLALEDGDFKAADDFCEKALDINPECSDAYLMKLMSKLKVRNMELLSASDRRIESDPLFQKALRFADEQKAETLRSCSDRIIENWKATKQREEDNLVRDTINDLRLIQDPNNTQDLQTKRRILNESIAKLSGIRGNQQADAALADCQQRIPEVINRNEYNRAELLMNSNDQEEVSRAGAMFLELQDYSDSPLKVRKCDKKIRKLLRREKNINGFSKFFVFNAILPFVPIILCINVILPFELFFDYKGFEEKYGEKFVEFLLCTIPIMINLLINYALLIYMKVKHNKNGNGIVVFCGFTTIFYIYGIIQLSLL